MRVCYYCHPDSSRFKLLLEHFLAQRTHSSPFPCEKAGYGRKLFPPLTCLFLMRALALPSEASQVNQSERSHAWWRAVSFAQAGPLSGARSSLGPEHGVPMFVPVQDSAAKEWCTLASDTFQGLSPLVPAKEFHGPGP